MAIGVGVLLGVGEYAKAVLVSADGRADLAGGIAGHGLSGVHRRVGGDGGKGVD